MTFFQSLELVWKLKILKYVEAILVYHTDGKRAITHFFTWISIEADTRVFFNWYVSYEKSFGLFYESYNFVWMHTMIEYFKKIIVGPRFDRSVRYSVLM